MIAAAAFYLFAAVLIASAVMVVTSRNPVHSVLFLISGYLLLTNEQCPAGTDLSHVTTEAEADRYFPSCRTGMTNLGRTAS